MFTVKATYRTETRKFVFTNAAEFPSYRALHDQLYRVFPISSNVYLSKLLFSPHGDGARLLIGVEVHDEDEYETHVKPYRGKQWNGALLRFTVYDETPHKVPSVLTVSTDETGTELGLGNGDAHAAASTTGPEEPRALRSLLSASSTAGLNGRYRPLSGISDTPTARELPHPPAFHPASYARAHDVPPSPWRWLPPPPPIPGSTAYPVVPPPPRSIRPVSSMPSLDLERPPLPPPPPRRPYRDSMTSFVAPPPPPPIVPPRPEVSVTVSPSSPDSQRARHLNRQLLHRLARRSRTAELDVEQNPSLANRHSWAGAGSSLDEILAQSSAYADALSRRPLRMGRPPAPDAHVPKPVGSEIREARRSAFAAAQRQISRKQPAQPLVEREMGIWGPWTSDDMHADEDKENVATTSAEVPAVAASTSTVKDDKKGRTIVIEDDSSDEVQIPVRIGKTKKSAARAVVEHLPERIDKGKRKAPPLPEYPSAPLPGRDCISSLPHPPWSLFAAPVDNSAPETRRHMPRKPVPATTSNDEVADKAGSAALQLAELTDAFTRIRDSVMDLIEDARQQKALDESKAAEAPAVPVAQPVVEPVVEAPKVVHTNIRCDACDKTIEGVRHKCLDCPDYDLCTPCITAARVDTSNPVPVGEVQALSGHQQNHIFFPIEEAGDLWLHTVFKNPAPAEQTGIAVPVAREEPAAAAVHNATCDLCDSSIIGSRFKCLNCPDWDTCSSCFAIVNEQHPGHAFIEVTDPSSVKHPRALSRSSFGPRMHHASCNACKQTIRGVRYKCMHPQCPDYDLCERCEALPHPVHPPTHAFLKLRNPELPISLFRAAPAPVYHVPPPPPIPAEPVLRLPSPPTFLPVEQTESTETVEERFPPIEALRGMPGMPGGFSPSPVIAPSPIFAPAPVLPPSPVVIEAFVTKEPLVVPPSEAASPYVTPSRTPVFPQVPTEMPGAMPHTLDTMEAEVARTIAYAEDAIAQADEVIRAVEHEHAIVDEPEPIEQAPAGTASTSGTGTPSAASRMSLPHVQPTDLTELFDLAAQFRHIWTQTRSATQAAPPAPVPAVQIPARRATEPVRAEMAQRVPQAVSFARPAAPSVPSSVSIPTELVLSSPSEPLAPAQPSPLSAHSLLASPPPVPRAAARSFVQPTRYEQHLRASAFSAAPSDLTSESASASRPLSMATDASSTVVGAPAPLRAAFVADNNIPDGQLFPPGAEFVKSWSMKNDGATAWPASTELVFVAGDRLGAAADAFKVGAVQPGEEVDVWTGEMKAPEKPGKYISYWRLSDGAGGRFGHSIWVDVVVAEAAASGSSESESTVSMSASSIVMMPQPASTTSAPVAAQDEATSAGKSEEDGDAETQSSVSFLDVPSDEEDVFEDSRSRSGAASRAEVGLRSPEDEFVVLYDSSDEDGF